MLSVIFAVKDGGIAFVECLRAVREQVTDEPVEIVVVDSGSADGSPDAARAAGATVTTIPPQSFSHGRSRNLGAREAQGETFVFLSQDAVPTDERWLQRLVAPLRVDDALAGVYGRQLPNDDAIPPETYFLTFLYGAESRRQRARHDGELSMATTLFSNVNAAMPRRMWERFPFAENIIMSEDQEWSRRVLLAGYAVAYEPAAAVRHSHTYTLTEAFRRFFDSGVSAERAYMAGRRHSSRVLRHTAIRYALGEIAWLCRSGQARWIPYAALYESSKMLGLLAGTHHEHLPAALTRRMSALPGACLPQGASAAAAAAAARSAPRSTPSAAMSSAASSTQNVQAPTHPG